MIVAPTCDLMSSPITGTPACLNLLFHSSLDAIKTGIQFTNAVFVSKHIFAQNSTAF